MFGAVLRRRALVHQQSLDPVQIGLHSKSVCQEPVGTAYAFHHLADAKRGMDVSKAIQKLCRWNALAAVRQVQLLPVA